MSQITINAQITGTASKVIFKNTSEGQSQYVLVDCTITDGPAKGKVVVGQFTTLNSKGTEREIPALDTNVALWVSALPATKGDGVALFYNIQLGSAKADNNEMAALLGITVDTMASQAL